MAGQTTRQATRDHEIQAWDLRCRLQYTEVQIAETLGVHQSTAHRMLARMEKRLFNELRDRAEAYKVRQTGQLHAIYEEAMTAWRKSTVDSEVVATTSGRSAMSSNGAVVDLPDQILTTRAGQSGNPALLAKAMDALESIRAIWGFNAPRATDITSGGEPVKALIGVDLEKI